VKRAAVFLLFCSFVALPAASARAMGADPTATKNIWARMDKCNHDAFTHFPDFTEKAAAQRAVFARNCEREARTVIHQDSVGHLPGAAASGSPQTNANSDMPGSDR
jgi:hypothetical protein